MLDSVIDLATTPQFLSGLFAGLIGLLIATPTSVLWRRRTGMPAPIAGALLAVATLAALPVTREVPRIVWIGMALLAAGGLLALLAPSNGWRGVVTVVAVAPGAILLGFFTELPGPEWARWLIAVGIVVAGSLVADFDGHHRTRAWGPPLLGLSVLGLLFTVPDTEEALVITGVALPLALLGGPVGLSSLGRTGSLMAVGVFFYVIALGGVGREGSMVGAAAALGLLIAEPVTRLIRGRSRLDAPMGPWAGIFVVGTFQLAVVLVASRVAGLQQQAGAAALVAALAIAGAAAIAVPRRVTDDQELVEE